MVGLAGESQNFDGNGSYVRFQVGGGTNTVALGAQARRPASSSGRRRSPCSACGRSTRASGRRTTRAFPVTRARSRTSTGRRAPAGRARGRREDRDPQALARLRGDPRPDRDRGRGRGVHPRQAAAHAARVGPARRQGLLRPQGRHVDRAGGHAGPGPDREHRGRRGRRDLERRAQGRQGRHHHEDAAEVQPRLPQRDRAAAAQDRAEGHGGRARAGDGRRGPAARGRRDPGRARRCRTSTSTRSSRRWTPTRATT